MPRGQTPLYHSWGLVSSTSLLWERVLVLGPVFDGSVFQAASFGAGLPGPSGPSLSKKTKEDRKGGPPGGISKNHPPLSWFVGATRRGPGTGLFRCCWVWKGSDPFDARGSSPLGSRAVDPLMRSRSAYERVQVRLRTCSLLAKRVPPLVWPRNAFHAKVAHNRPSRS